MEDRRERILALQAREHSLAPPVAVPFKPGTVSGLQARGALDPRQARTANRLLWVLTREGPVPYNEAKLAVGRAFAILEAVIILGEPLSHYAKRHRLHHYAASSDLRRALDLLAEHFAGTTAP